MKCKLLLCLFIFSSQLIHSQKKKYYLDEYSNKITKHDFKGYHDRLKYLQLNFENDTARICKVERRELKAKLSKVKYDLLLNYLGKKDSKIINTTKTIVINYYPGKDQCNSTGNNYYLMNLYKDYLKEVDMLEDVNQYFFYKSVDGLEFFRDSFNWLADDEKTIEQLFFPLHYPCFSYVIIYPKGEYYLYKGEYYLPEIFDKLKDYKLSQ